MKIIGLDTETQLVNKVQTFTCFSAYSEDVPIMMYSQDPEDLGKLFCRKNRQAYFFCHNLEFDFGVLRSWLEQHFEIEVQYAKSRIIAIYLSQNGKRRFTMLDSMNFYPMSLKKVGSIVGLEKLEHPEYLGKRMPETREEHVYYREYALRDSIIVYKAMRLFAETVDNKLGLTIASTCLKYYRHKFLDFHKTPNKFKTYGWMNKDVRHSYFGGRVESYYRGMVTSEMFDPINVYDFNSLYPSVMLKDMPDMTKLPVVKQGSYDNEALGSAMVTLKTECEYPIFPEMTDKLRFRCGKLKGWFTIPELEAMQEMGEGKIIKVHKSYNWDKIPSYFKEYVNHFYKGRLKLKQENNPREKIFKLMLNSLYGKWGEVIEPTTYKQINNVDDFANADNIIGNYAITKGKPKFTKHTFFAIASTITAYSRLKLHEAIHEVSDKRRKEVFYADTDSIFTNAKLNTSKELGDLKLEYSKDWFVFIRAKAYLSDDFVKLKGSSMNLKPADILKNLSDGKQIGVDQERLVRFKESFKRKNRKHLQQEFRKKMFNTGSDGKRYYPRNLDSKKLLQTFSPSIPIGYPRGC